MHYRSLAQIRLLAIAALLVVPLFTITNIAIAYPPQGADGPLATERMLLISRNEYRQHLRGMWLAECIANWTGKRTELSRTEPPFYTDEDWGTTLPSGKVIEFILDQDPWESDDDTDIEYVYLYLMDQHSPWLTPEQIAQGWKDHINDYIWVSNAKARSLMDRGILPPVTGTAVANKFSLFIDAQLTTEMFGVYSPGRPDIALQLANLPIRTTADGYAAHAAQIFVVMYSLAPIVPAELSPRDKVLWLVDQAEKFIPDTSKTTDIIDFVRNEYLTNPDKNDWESTRDAIYDRYQLHDDQYGFVYRGPTESSVNFATAIMALLYGEGDFSRSVQIATLSGWDSDNPSATIGGLLGLMFGYDYICSEFPEVVFSDRYHIGTRDNMPNYTGDQDAEDTFQLIAERQLEHINTIINSIGGHFNSEMQQWYVIYKSYSTGWVDNPLNYIYEHSSNNSVSLQGGNISTSSSVVSDPPENYGTRFHSSIANTREFNFSGMEPDRTAKFYSSQNAGALTGDWQTLTVTYDIPVTITAVRLMEGDHFNDDIAHGGYFIYDDNDPNNNPYIELHIDNSWVSANVTNESEPLDNSIPFQIIDYILDQPVTINGFRISGRVGGEDAFVTISELDGILFP